MAEQFKTFYIPICDDGAMEEALNTFLASHRVLTVDKVFAGDGWAFCVAWITGTPARGVSNRGGIKTDYRTILSEDEFSRFSHLRALRKELATENGVAPYMILTDSQMAEAARMEELSITALKKINGFGDARAERYGERILTELKKLSAPEDGADE